MCLSASADLVGGLVIGVLGVDALHHVRSSRERWLVAVPLILGLHQLVEAFVWWGLQGHVPAALGRVATWIYLLVAFGVLPVFVPLVMAIVEPRPTRRWLVVPFGAVGAVVSAVLVEAVVHGPVTAHLERYHVAYGTGLGSGTVIVSAYLVATCGSLLVSSYRHVAVFGVVNLVAAAIIARLTTSGFISLWCAWAAVTGGAIALDLRQARTHRRPAAVAV